MLYVNISIQTLLNLLFNFKIKKYVVYFHESILSKDKFPNCTLLAAAIYAHHNLFDSICKWLTTSIHPQFPQSLKCINQHIFNTKLYGEQGTTIYVYHSYIYAIFVIASQITIRAISVCLFVTVHESKCWQIRKHFFGLMNEV